MRSPRTRATRARPTPPAVPSACVLCGRRDFLLVTRCEVTGEPVVTCIDPLGCLERAHGPEGARLRVARLLAALRGDRRPGGSRDLRPSGAPTVGLER